MAKLKFEQEKAQLESVLNQQMGIYQRNLAGAMADNVITPQESEVLAGNLDTINQLMAQIQSLQAQDTMPQQQQQVQRQPVTPESLGNRPPSNHGDSSRTEIDAGRVLAEIIARLDRIESQSSRYSRPSSGSRGTDAGGSRRRTVRCEATTTKGTQCTRTVKEGDRCWQHR